MRPEGLQAHRRTYKVCAVAEPVTGHAGWGGAGRPGSLHRLPHSVTVLRPQRCEARDRRWYHRSPCLVTRTFGLHMKALPAVVDQAGGVDRHGAAAAPSVATYRKQGRAVGQDDRWSRCVAVAREQVLPTWQADSPGRHVDAVEAAAVMTSSAAPRPALWASGRTARGRRATRHGSFACRAGRRGLERLAHISRRPVRPAGLGRHYRSVAFAASLQARRRNLRCHGTSTARLW